MPLFHRFILLFALTSPAIGQVYKTVDEHGNVTYSDTPSKSSKKIELPPVNVQPAITPAPTETATAVIPSPTLISSPAFMPNSTVVPSPTAETKAPDQKEPDPTGYGLRLVLPKPNTNILPNENISLVILTKRPLTSSLKFQATIDGKPVGEPTSANNISLPYPKERQGKLMLGTQIVDDKGEIIETSAAIPIVIIHH